MPFQVSILDSNGDASANGVDGTVTLVDYSNYSTSGEVGHDQSDFSDYKKITLTSRGGYSYVLSTLVGGDVLISPPSAEILPITHTIPYDVDDVHNIVLIAIPTWDNAVTYNILDGPCVYYNTKLYECIKSGTNKNPVTEITYWTEIDDDDLNEKYRSSYTWGIIYDILTEYANQVRLANDETKPITQDRIFENKHFQTSAKLWCMTESIEVESGLEQWDRVEDTITKAKSIINEL